MNTAANIIALLSAATQEGPNGPNQLAGALVPLIQSDLLIAYKASFRIRNPVNGDYIENFINWSKNNSIVIDGTDPTTKNHLKLRISTDYLKFLIFKQLQGNYRVLVLCSSFGESIDFILNCPNNNYMFCIKSGGTRDDSRNKKSFAKARSGLTHPDPLIKALAGEYMKFAKGLPNACYEGYTHLSQIRTFQYDYTICIDGLLDFYPKDYIPLIRRTESIFISTMHYCPEAFMMRGKKVYTQYFDTYWLKETKTDNYITMYFTGDSFSYVQNANICKAWWFGNVFGTLFYDPIFANGGYGLFEIGLLEKSVVVKPVIMRSLNNVVRVPKIFNMVEYGKMIPIIVDEHKLDTCIDFCLQRFTNGNNIDIGAIVQYVRTNIGKTNLVGKITLGKWEFYDEDICDIVAAIMFEVSLKRNELSRLFPLLSNLFSSGLKFGWKTRLFTWKWNRFKNWLDNLINGPDVLKIYEDYKRFDFETDFVLMNKFNDFKTNFRIMDFKLSDFLKVGGRESTALETFKRDVLHYDPKIHLGEPHGSIKIQEFKDLFEDKILLHLGVEPGFMIKELSRNVKSLLIVIPKVYEVPINPKIKNFGFHVDCKFKYLCDNHIKLNAANFLISENVSYLPEFRVSDALHYRADYIFSDISCCNGTDCLVSNQPYCHNPLKWLEFWCALAKTGKKIVCKVNTPLLEDVIKILDLYNINVEIQSRSANANPMSFEMYLKLTNKILPNIKSYKNMVMKFLFPVLNNWNTFMHYEEVIQSYKPIESVEKCLPESEASSDWTTTDDESVKSEKSERILVMENESAESELEDNRFSSQIPTSTTLIPSPFVQAQNQIAENAIVYSVQPVVVLPKMKYGIEAIGYDSNKFKNSFFASKMEEYLELAIIGDGLCFIRALSAIIYGDQEQFIKIWNERMVMKFGPDIRSLTLSATREFIIENKIPCYDYELDKTYKGFQNDKNYFGCLLLFPSHCDVVFQQPCSKPRTSFKQHAFIRKFIPLDVVKMQYITVNLESFTKLKVNDVKEKMIAMLSTTDPTYKKTHDNAIVNINKIQVGMERNFEIFVVQGAPGAAKTETALDIVLEETKKQSFSVLYLASSREALTGVISRYCEKIDSDFTDSYNHLKFFVKTFAAAFADKKNSKETYMPMACDIRLIVLDECFTYVNYYIQALTMVFQKAKILCLGDIDQFSVDINQHWSPQLKVQTLRLDNFINCLTGHQGKVGLYNGPDYFGWHKMNVTRRFGPNGVKIAKKVSGLPLYCDNLNPFEIEVRDVTKLDADLKLAGPDDLLLVASREEFAKKETFSEVKSVRQSQGASVDTTRIYLDATTAYAMNSFHATVYVAVTRSKKRLILYCEDKLSEASLNVQALFKNYIYEYVGGLHIREVHLNFKTPEQIRGGQKPFEHDPVKSLMPAELVRENVRQTQDVDNYLLEELQMGRPTVDQKTPKFHEVYLKVKNMSVPKITIADLKQFEELPEGNIIEHMNADPIEIGNVNIGINQAKSISKVVKVITETFTGNRHYVSSKNQNDATIVHRMGVAAKTRVKHKNYKVHFKTIQRRFMEVFMNQEAFEGFMNANVLEYFTSAAVNDFREVMKFSVADNEMTVRHLMLKATEHLKTQIKSKDLESTLKNKLGQPIIAGEKALNNLYSPLFRLMKSILIKCLDEKIIWDSGLTMKDKMERWALNNLDPAWILMNDFPEFDASQSEETNYGQFLIWTLLNPYSDMLTDYFKIVNNLFVFGEGLTFVMFGQRPSGFPDTFDGNTLKQLLDWLIAGDKGVFGEAWFDQILKMILGGDDSGISSLSDPLRIFNFTWLVSMSYAPLKMFVVRHGVMEFSNWLFKNGIAVYNPQMLMKKINNKVYTEILKSAEKWYEWTDSVKNTIAYMKEYYWESIDIVSTWFDWTKEYTEYYHNVLIAYSQFSYYKALKELKPFEIHLEDIYVGGDVKPIQILETELTIHKNIKMSNYVSLVKEHVERCPICTYPTEKYDVFGPQHMPTFRCFIENNSCRRGYPLVGMGSTKAAAKLEAFSKLWDIIEHCNMKASKNVENFYAKLLKEPNTILPCNMPGASNVVVNVESSAKIEMEEVINRLAEKINVKEKADFSDINFKQTLKEETGLAGVVVKNNNNALGEKTPMPVLISPPKELDTNDLIEVAHEVSIYGKIVEISNEEQEYQRRGNIIFHKKEARNAASHWYNEKYVLKHFQEASLATEVTFAHCLSFITSECTPFYKCCNCDALNFPVKLRKTNATKCWKCRDDKINHHSKGFVEIQLTDRADTFWIPVFGEAIKIVRELGKGKLPKQKSVKKAVKKEIKQATRQEKKVVKQAIKKEIKTLAKKQGKPLNRKGLIKMTKGIHANADVVAFVRSIINPYGAPDFRFPSDWQTFKTTCLQPFRRFPLPFVASASTSGAYQTLPNNEMMVFAFKNPLRGLIYYHPNVNKAGFGYQIQGASGSGIKESTPSNSWSLVGANGVFIGKQRLFTPYALALSDFAPHGQTLYAGSIGKSRIGRFFFAMKGTVFTMSLVTAGGTGTATTGLDSWNFDTGLTEGAALGNSVTAAGTTNVTITAPSTAYYCLWINNQGSYTTFNVQGASMSTPGGTLVDGGVWGHLPYNDAQKFIASTPALRTFGVSTLFTNTDNWLNRGGQIVQQVLPSGRHWTEFVYPENLTAPYQVSSVPLYGYGLLSSYKDVDFRGADKGSYMWLSPESIDDFRMKCDWTLDGDDLQDSFYDLTAEEPFTAWAFNGTPEMQNGTLTVATSCEAITTDTTRPTAISSCDPIVIEETQKVLRPMSRYSDNPGHIAMIAGLLKKAFDFTADAVIEVGPKAIKAAKTYKDFMT